MTDPVLSINGALCTRIRLSVPGIGAWVADVDVSDQADLAGAAVLAIGSLELHGTVSVSGSFQYKTRARVVGGKGGWAQAVTARHFHNDAGLKRWHVAQALASAVGETLAHDGSISESELVGVDWVRRAGSAGRALAALYPVWWVDYAGVTQVAQARGSADLVASFDLLDFNPRSRVASLAIDTPEALVVGSVLHDRLEAPARVRAFTLEAQGSALRVAALTEAA